MTPIRIALYDVAQVALSEPEEVFQPSGELVTFRYLRFYDSPSNLIANVTVYGTKGYGVDWLGLRSDEARPIIVRKAQGVELSFHYVEKILSDGPNQGSRVFHLVRDGRADVSIIAHANGQRHINVTEL